MGGSSSSSDFLFLEILSFFVFFVLLFVVVHVSPQKKLDRGVGRCELANPSFSRIFGFFFKLTRPLILLAYNWGVLFLKDVRGITNGTICDIIIASLKQYFVLTLYTQSHHLHLLEVASRYRDPKLQVVENYSNSHNLRPNICKSWSWSTRFIFNNCDLTG